MDTVTKMDTMIEQDVEDMLKAIQDSPECSCESNHKWLHFRESKTMPTPCTGEASYRYIWPQKKHDFLVCKGWAADYNSGIFSSGVYKESKLLPV